jgi:hypothetical protein
LLNVSEVVDVPYTTKKMWRLAIGNELPLIKDKEGILRKKALNGTLSKAELDTGGALRYPVADIREIRIECRWLQNVVVICLLHQKDVTFNKTRSDTITVDSAYMALWGTFDSTGQYIVYGLPGKYSISISHSLFEPFSQNGVYVSQWSEVTCEHANTENLIIALDKINLKKKKMNKSSGIISQKTQGHC